MEQVTDILKSTRELLDNKTNWTQNDSARKKNDFPEPSTEEDYVQWREV